jgi:hypothetical protein
MIYKIITLFVCVVIGLSIHDIIADAVERGVKGTGWIFVVMYVTFMLLGGFFVIYWVTLIFR